MFKKFRVIKLKFWPVVNGESRMPKISEVLGKKFLWFTIASGNELNLFVIPLEDIEKSGAGVGSGQPGKPEFAFVLTAILAVTAIGLTAFLLRSVKDVSGIFYAGFGVAALITFRQLGFKLK